jgi:hypothetical protein
VFQELLTKLALALDRAGIPYMIIGGQAVLVYGEPRLTKDIDITLGVGPQEVKKLLALSSLLGLKTLTEKPEEFAQKTCVLPTVHENTGIRVDFVFSFSPYEQQALSRVNKIVFPANIDQKVNFASLEDIIIHKIVAGRPRDIEDVRSILLKNPGYDRNYILQWLREFSSTLDQDFTTPFTSLEADIREP